jgi:hypothetical protein
MKAFIVAKGTRVRVAKKGQLPREHFTRKENLFFLEEVTFDPYTTSDPRSTSYCFSRDGWDVWVRFVDVQVR